MHTRHELNLGLHSSIIFFAHPSFSIALPVGGAVPPSFVAALTSSAADAP